MIKLSEEAKAKYAKYVDQNGRLIVDESLPEDVKKAFNYFNSKGINVMELSVDDDIIDLPEEEEEYDDEQEIFDNEEQFDENSDSFEDEENDVNLNELNDLF